MKNIKKIEALRKKTRDFMYERNMTLAIAATFFELSIGTLSKFLNGHTNPHARSLYRIRKRIGESEKE